jgi:hypothetical protein
VLLLLLVVVVVVLGDAEPDIGCLMSGLWSTGSAI